MPGLKRRGARAMGPGEQAAFLNSILESSTEYSIIATDLAGRILAWNEGARRLYGYRSADVVDKADVFQLHDPDDVRSGVARAQLEEARASGKWIGDVGRVRKDGSRFTANVTITLRRGPSRKPAGFTIISRDLREANRLKSEFLANMSHELRTPLNGIIGFAELMHDGKVGAVAPMHKEYLSDILTSAGHLLQLINDVLDLAKVESGKMEFRPEQVDVRKTFEEVRDILRTMAARKRIRVELEVGAGAGTAYLDPARLKQVLYNYLSNALKFTPDEGRVTMRARPEGKEKLLIEVEDTGIGIASEQMIRLFVEFQQLDASAAKKYQGTGLGLALTRRVVEAQGGRVGVQSTPGKGSIFSALLPLPAGPAEGKAVLRGRGRKVLVIEDDARDRAWLEQTLSKAGWSVLSAASGREALDLANGTRFDALTIDLLLPDMSGWEVLRALRDHGPNQNTPVVVVTMLGAKEAQPAMPVQGYLVKPVQAVELLSALEGAAHESGVRA